MMMFEDSGRHLPSWTRCPRGPGAQLAGHGEPPGGVGHFLSDLRSASVLLSAQGFDEGTFQQAQGCWWLLSRYGKIIGICVWHRHAGMGGLQWQHSPFLIVEFACLVVNCPIFLITFLLGRHGKIFIGRVAIVFQIMARPPISGLNLDRTIHWNYHVEINISRMFFGFVFPANPYFLIFHPPKIDFNWPETLSFCWLNGVQSSFSSWTAQFFTVNIG